MLQVIVEWRALTVAALDVIVEELRTRLGVDAATFPLVKVPVTNTHSVLSLPCALLAVCCVPMCGLGGLFRACLR